MGKPSSPRSDKELLLSLGEDAFHKSFCRLPNEEPIHKWDTDEAIEHARHLKKLDKQLAKYNQEIAMLKDMLKEEDEKCETHLEQLAEREQAAMQAAADLKEKEQLAAQESFSYKIQLSQLQAKLSTNTQKIKALQNEGKKLNKDLRRQEKLMEKLSAQNMKLEKSSASVLESYSELCDSKVFEDSNALHDALDENMELHFGYNEYTQAMQDRYMNEAEQRLELQKAMANILFVIQSDCTNAKLANACTKVGLACQERAAKLMAELEAKYDDAV